MADETRDPVCGMTIDARHARFSATYEGTVYHFCSSSCRDLFVANPFPYVQRARDQRQE